jgi:hypothetical protein
VREMANFVFAQHTKPVKSKMWKVNGAGVGGSIRKRFTFQLSRFTP